MLSLKRGNVLSYLLPLKKAKWSCISQHVIKLYLMPALESPLSSFRTDQQVSAGLIHIVYTYTHIPRNSQLTLPGNLATDWVSPDPSNGRTPSSRDEYHSISYLENLTLWYYPLPASASVLSLSPSRQMGWVRKAHVTVNIFTASLGDRRK